MVATYTTYAATVFAPFKWRHKERHRIERCYSPALQSIFARWRNLIATVPSVDGVDCTQRWLHLANGGENNARYRVRCSVSCGVQTRLRNFAIKINNNIK